MNLEQTTVKNTFAPTETWRLDEALEEPVQQALHVMNQKDPAALIQGLKDEVEEAPNGAKLAILRGENPEEYSDTDALVMFNPFGNAATPNMLVRAEFVREVAQAADVRDEQGKFKPVIMLASPGVNGSSLSLDKEGRNQIKNGDLGPVAREMLQAVTERDFGRIALLGFSQGADMALAGARTAYGTNLDTHALAIGDPAGVEDRGMVRLGLDFMKAPDIKPSVEATGLEAQKVALGKGVKDMANFAASAVRSDNRLLIRGMGKDTFEDSMQEILENDAVDKLVVGYGGESAIAKPEVIEPALQNLHIGHKQNDLISVKVHGADHTWGDQLTLLSKLYMRAVA